MYAFRTTGRGGLDLPFDLSRVGYANISFFDATRSEIPLHISLRGEGIAVFNRRLSGHWQAERPVPLPQGATLRFAFAEDRVTVHLDDALLFDLGPEDCQDLDRIVWHELSGGFDAEAMRLTGAGNESRRGRGGLVLVQPFGIAGWGVDPALQVQAAQLDWGIAGDAPQVWWTPRPDLAEPDGPVPMAVDLQVPGRVWADLPEGADLRIALRVNGAPCGADLTLSRAQMAAALEALLRHPGLETADDTGLLAIEHVQHGGFWPDLSAQAQGRLVQVARRFGLDDLLPTAAATPVLTPALALPEPDPAEILRQGVLRALARDPKADPLALLPAAPDLTSAQRWALYLGLTEVFCQSDRMEALYARALSENIGAVYAARDDLWDLSVRLPWLWLARDLQAVADLGWRMNDIRQGAPADHALAWVLIRAAEDPDPRLRPEARERVIYALLEGLDRRAWQYWEHHASQALIAAMVRLIGAAGRMPDYVAPRIWQVAIRTLGTSPRFWAAMDEAGLGQDGVLALARRAFLQVQDGQPEEVEAGLRVLRALDQPDVLRLRREIFGVADLGRGGQSLLAQALACGEDAGAALLRALAFPQAAQVHASEDIAAAAPLVRRAIIALTPQVPHDGLHEVQQDLSRAVLGLLQSGGPVDLARLAPAITALAGPDRMHLGLGIGLSLLAGLLRRQADSPEAPGLARLLEADIARLDSAARSFLPGAAAVQGGLAMLSAAIRAEAEDELHPAQDLAEGLARQIGADLPAPPPLPRLRVPAALPALVVVLSCQPYLSTRIPALRDAWLKDLAALGVPHVIAVGGGTGPARLEGDVLILPVSDSYEDLPAKTLAAVAWVHDQTDAAHLVKIDDDCFLNADLYFHAQSWRKHHYHGRVLTRVKGDMDRAWHQGKSRSARGRMELDRSPEPSTYCDGGSAYALSRHAMAALLDQAARPEGRALIAGSFMEDKLVGDLLARAGIFPSGEDHSVSLWRRMPGSARPVAIWANGFLPSRLNPVKLAHLDDAAAQAGAAAALAAPVLRPAKIWPGFSAPHLGLNTNLLELQSPVEKLQDLNRAGVAVVATLRNEMFMVRHFLDHYRALGVQCFLIADNLSDDGTLDFLLDQPDVVTFSVDTDYRLSAYGVAWQQAILSNLRVGRWSLVADADELLVAEGSLQDLVDGLEPGADAMRLYMLDLYPRGPLSEAGFAKGPFAEAGYCDAAPFLRETPWSGPFGDQPTVTSALRHRLMPGSRPDLFVAQKLALLRYRPWMRLTAGLHYVGEAQIAAREGILAHFKYNAQFAEKARAEVARRQHFNDAEEYRKYLAILAEGRDVLFDPAVSVPWVDSAEVRRILGR